MRLQETIEQELIAAMKAGETEKRDTLRMLKSALQNSAIELAKTELTDEEVLSVIGKEAKKRRESIVAYEQAGKPDLMKSEQDELTLLEKYLPTQLDEAMIRTKVQAYLSAHPTTPDQTGRVIGALSGELKGQADMGLVAKIVREELSK